MFPTHYEDALKEWVQVREDAADSPLESALHQIHNWWQQAPMVNHNLHIADFMDWPGPWELLAENNYCEVAKCLMKVYTILIARDEEFPMYILQTENNIYLRIQADKEYIIGNEAGTITSIIEEKVLHQIDCKFFKNKL